MKPITLKGMPLAEGRLPAVCIPLVARTADALRLEAAAVARLAPDLVEWRVDFFEGLGRTGEVVALAAEIRRTAGAPLLFTRRSEREGGQKIDLDEPRVVELYRAVCAAGAADIVDMEMEAERAHLDVVRDAARARGIALLLSFHDFAATAPAS
jgi:3-dehydroquinate dehydratase I